MTEWANIAQFGAEQTKDYHFPRQQQLQAGTSPIDMPLPPAEIRLYGESDADHISGGQYDYDKIKLGLSYAGHDISEFNSIFELGCSNGRVFRWFVPEGYRGAEVWGTDIDARRAFWSQINFAPYAHVAITTPIPHLPFKDGKFDFVYAISILTHLDPTWLSWFAELSRILRPNGLAWITIHDEVAAEWMASSSEYFPMRIKNETRFLEFKNGDPEWYATGEGVMRNTFYNRKWFLDRISPIFQLVTTVEKTTGGYQTGLLLRKI